MTTNKNKSPEGMKTEGDDDDVENAQRRLFGVSGSRAMMVFELLLHLFRSYCSRGAVRRLFSHTALATADWHVCEKDHQEYYSSSIRSSFISSHIRQTRMCHTQKTTIRFTITTTTTADIPLHVRCTAKSQGNEPLARHKHTANVCVQDSH